MKKQNKKHPLFNLNNKNSHRNSDSFVINYDIENLEKINIVTYELQYVEP